MLTIIAALSDEIRQVRDEMETDEAIHIKRFSIHIGRYQGKKIALLKSGVGAKKMEEAAAYCIENLKPELLMSTGYAGGLIPELRAGEIVISNSVAMQTPEKTWDVDAMLVQKASAVLAKSGLKGTTGRTVTVERPLSEPHEKALVGSQFEAIACDMESAILAEKAAAAGLPYLVVRAIFDPMDTLLPDIPASAVSDGEISAGGLLGHLVSNPKDIFKLPQFNRLAFEARNSITAFIRAWCLS